MARPVVLLLCCSLLLVASSSKWKAAARTVPVEYLYPPYNLTYFHFIDTNGVFLRSPNATFAAAVYTPASDTSGDTQTLFFFSVIHDASRTPVWTATDGATIVQSIVLSLTASGLALSDPADLSAPPAWSTPANLAAPVAAMRLLDTGQLTLLDAANATLWSSFDAPTDTLLPGQTLPVGVPLTGTVSDQDLSRGAYRLILTTTDALLQWRTMTSTNSSSDGGFVTYWALSSDAASVQQSNQAVHSMKVNATGIYLLADNAIDTVFTLLFADPLPSKLLKVHSSGRLRALSMAYSPTAARATLPAVWAAPASDCDLPLPCGSLGLCTPGNNGSSCMCPDAFSTHTTGGCAPADGTALPVPAQACHAADNASSSSSSAATKQPYGYMSLGDGVGYFGSKFAVPVTAGDAFPACQDLCSANCSCLGFLYKNSSKSCFLLHDQIGSVLRARTDGTVGFIKTLPPLRSSRRHGSSSALSSITIVFGIVLPTVAAVFITFLLYVLAVHWLKNRRSPDGGKKKNKKHGGGGNGHGSSWFMLKMMSSRSSSRASSNAPSEMGDDDNEDHDDDEVLIPGLPARFTFADLEAATSGFRSQIGSGGFGSVYRGELPDRTTVAVKRMNNLGTQGRREFLTEIAVIGNVHHVNLVKLRGFCADHSRQLMLVYEFMSRGSLDQSLFLSRSGSKKTQALLEWPERVGVCVGAARGLAYLHAGCDRKILHCDVKPENILLDERGGVKIADFGLAKLLSPEQSGLFTTMRGTRGYLAPEWLTNAPVSDKADVYSFGMVLLEIVRGAKNSKLLQDDDNTAASSSAVSSSASSEGHGSSGSYFPAVALEAHEEGGRRYAELVDARLEGRAIAAEVARVVRVALCCLHEDASLRPAMTAVAAMLDGSMEVCEPRTEQLAYLRMYGRGIVGGGSKWKGSDITTGGASSSWSPPSCVSAQQLSAPR
ncbi:hypothetical protein QYE76_000267 [Lolium multiflorum]|uniref:non-specific serine/threonine protein kinase n=1 Tax=Lolium multiflorum TaxID=4521 RepID=A0AAD8VW75_LOLMU|nr:hypothetical protein QYE76_000267 [Lolium multiflorum]